MLLLLLFVFLFSCGPKYKIVKEYIPSQNSLCIQDCKEKFLDCKRSCFENYTECVRESQERARKVYETLLREYEKKYTIYEKEYENYLKSLRIYRKTLSRLMEDLKFYENICSAYKDAEACRRRELLRKKLSIYRKRKPFPPKKPIMPSYELILKRERKACLCDCGCEKLYDACFEACGGKIHLKRICIEKCD